MTIPHIEFVLDWGMLEAQAESFGTAAAIYYSTGSCWWSHHRGHSMIYPGMKCPAGGQIVMEKDWRAWLETARDNPDHYGKHGLQALLAAHHSNCRAPDTGGFYAARSWTPYNDALDVLADEEERKGGAPRKVIDLKPIKRPGPTFSTPKRGLRRG